MVCRCRQQKPAGKRVIKPVKGCGAQGVRISDGLTGPGEFAAAVY